MAGATAILSPAPRSPRNNDQGQGVAQVAPRRSLLCSTVVMRPRRASTRPGEQQQLQALLCSTGSAVASTRSHKRVSLRVRLVHKCERVQWGAPLPPSGYVYQTAFLHSNPISSAGFRNECAWRTSTRPGAACTAFRSPPWRTGTVADTLRRTRAANDLRGDAASRSCVQ